MQADAIRVDKLRKAIETFLCSSDKSKAVCFDYFDTIVYRDVHPEYLKQLSSKLLSNALLGTISADELGALRVTFERELCENNNKFGYDLDFRIDQLARKLFSYLNSRLPDKFKDQTNFIKLFVEIEISLELEHQKVDKDIYRLIVDLAASGAKTILLSDFYIPSKYMEKILDKHGLSDYFDQIHFSSDYLITKSSGKLYQHLKEANSKIECFYMVGDNPHSDNLMAEENGFESYSLDRIRSVETYEQEYSQVPYQNELSRKFDSLNEDCITSPFKDLSYPLAYFCKNLYSKLMQNDAEVVLFMSKEGQFLRKCFDEYIRCHGLDATIKSKYIIVSRKSTYLCSIDLDSDNPFERLFWQYDRNSSIEDLLKSLNFTEEELAEVQKHLVIDIAERHVLLSKSNALEQLIESKWFTAFAKRKIKLQSYYLNEYIKSKIGRGVKSVHVVDVGWKGTIQDNLFLSLKKEYRIYGYYLGLLYPTLLEENNRKEGVLFSNHLDESRHLKIYNSNRSLYEMILGANHGSASRYINNVFQGDGVSQSERIYEEYKCNNEVSFVYVDDNVVENEIYLTQIKGVQDSIFKLFKKIVRVERYKEESIVNERNSAIKQFKMNFMPSVTEIDYYQNLKHLENFGVFQYTVFNTKSNIQIIDRVKNTIKFWRDPHLLLESGYWPPVVIKQNAINISSNIILKKLASVIEENEL